MSPASYVLERTSQIFPKVGMMRRLPFTWVPVILCLLVVAFPCEAFRIRPQMSRLPAVKNVFAFANAPPHPAQLQLLRSYTLEESDFLKILREGRWVHKRDALSLLKTRPSRLADRIDKEKPETKSICTEGTMVTRSGHAFIWIATQFSLVLIDDEGGIAYLSCDKEIRLKPGNFENDTPLAWERAEKFGRMQPPTWRKIKFIRNVYCGESPRAIVGEQQLLNIFKTWQPRHDFVTWKSQWGMSNAGIIRCGVVTNEKGVYYWSLLSSNVLQVFNEAGASCLLVAPLAGAENP